LRRGPPGAAEARRLRVLVAAWESPSRHSGGGTYLLELLRRLGARHDVTLVHTRGADEAGHVDELGPYLARIVTLERSHGESRYRGDRSFPERLYDVYMPELRRALELELLRERYDLVDYQYTAMAPYVVSGLPSVLTVHEAGYTAILNTRFARARDAVLAVPDLDELLRSFHFLTDALPALCPALVTLTDEDAAALAPYTDVPLYTSPVGVARGPAPKARHRDRAAPRLVYVGNFQHPPNIHAVRFLAAEVMPLLRRRYPDAELRIHGTRIPAEVSALHGQGGIRVLGFAPELGRELRRATALVAPLFTGTGMRVKVAEALGAGALVIGTDLALRGIEAVPGRHFLRAHTPAEFVEQIARAFDDPSLALEIAERGQRLAAERHGWDAAVRARESIWWAVVARTATESSGDAADEAEAADAADEADE
ncbi:MAG: glycosyltransferase, partial [Deltaproteobacteria bacterium]|nr:glycosyltransferase [Deltaproteobacteria bacterium]